MDKQILELFEDYYNNNYYLDYIFFNVINN